jgi:hypothetical protein
MLLSKIMSTRRHHSQIEERERDGDSAPDLGDVPATVFCVHCLSAECTGCEPNDMRSGIVQIIPWEREGSLWSRLWSTSYLATLESQAFFSKMTDGPILPALTFAFFAELVSASAMALFGGLAVLASAPSVVIPFLQDASSRGWLIRIALVAIPALASLLVAAHAAHGSWIDRGARKNGAASAHNRALRFGLYACGWDVLLGPVGLITLLLRREKQANGGGGGGGGTAALFASASGLPTRATEAFLQGHYRLHGEKMRAAVRTSYTGAFIATAVLAVLIAGTIIAVLFALMSTH